MSGFSRSVAGLPKCLNKISLTFGMRVDPPTRITSSIYFVVKLASSRAYLTSGMHLKNIPRQISSNWLLLISISRSIALAIESIKIEVWCSVDSAYFALLHSYRIRSFACLLFDKSISSDFMNSLMQWSIRELSMSYPPSWGSPV